jgi:putative transcriptional regulator
MSERDIGLEILKGIREIKAFKAGKIGLKTRELKEPSPPQEIRLKLNLSQAAFAGLMGVSLRTVQDWEQGRRQPSGPAKSLLRIAEQHPDVFIALEELVT